VPIGPRYETEFLVSWVKSSKAGLLSRWYAGDGKPAFFVAGSKEPVFFIWFPDPALRHHIERSHYYEESNLYSAHPKPDVFYTGIGLHDHARYQGGISASQRALARRDCRGFATPACSGLDPAGQQIEWS